MTTDPERRSVDPGEADHLRDHALTQAVLARDPHAIDIVVKRLRCVPRILAVHNRRLGKRLTPHDLEDLSQEVVAVILQKLETFNGTSTLESWAHGICHFQFMNRIRRHVRDSERYPQLAEGPHTDPKGAFDADPLEEELVRASLDDLPSEEALVVRLKHYEQLSFLEAAERLQISPNTAKSRYYRAIRTLQQRLGPKLRHEEAT